MQVVWIEPAPRWLIDPPEAPGALQREIRPLHGAQHDVFRGDTSSWNQPRNSSPEICILTCILAKENWPR